ncbi:MAG: hypothetical protein ACXAC8_19665 [Candidatus Hodarchaeales archaeon]
MIKENDFEFIFDIIKFLINIWGNYWIYIIIGLIILYIAALIYQRRVNKRRQKEWAKNNP